MTRGLLRNDPFISLSLFFAALLTSLALLNVPAHAETLLHYTSESGDYIGQGQERTIVPGGGFDFSVNGGTNSVHFSGNLATFAANFVQHSEGADPASYGQVRYNSTVPYLTPAGVAQLGNNHYGAFSRDGRLVVKVTRRGGGNGPLSVDYTTADGTDLAGRDYTATSGTIT